MGLDYAAIVEDANESFVPTEAGEGEMTADDVNSAVFKRDEGFAPDEEKTSRENLEKEGDLVARKGGSQPKEEKAAPKKTQAEMLKSMKFKIKDESGEQVMDMDALVATARKAAALEKQLLQYQSTSTNTQAEKKTIDIVEDMMAQGKSVAEIKQVLEEKYARLLEDENKSPEQKRHEENEKKLKEYEAEKKRQAEEQEKTKRSEDIVARQRDLEQKLVEAFEEGKYLPKDPLFMKFAVQEMIGAKAVGHNLTPKEAVKIVEGKAVDMIAQMVRRSPLPFVKKLLGEDIIAKIREDSVKEYKQSAQQFQQPFNKQPAKAAPLNMQTEPKEKLNQKEFFKRLRELPTK